MDKSEEYRRKAEHCQQMADAARKEVDRQEWLLLAQSWRQMQPGGPVSRIVEKPIPHDLEYRAAGAAGNARPGTRHLVQS